MADLDVAFRLFQMSYPAGKRTGGARTEHAWVQSVSAAGGVKALQDALEAARATKAWKEGIIPTLETWLRDEHWRRAEEAPQASVVVPPSPLRARTSYGEMPRCEACGWMVQPVGPPHRCEAPWTETDAPA